MPENRVLSTLFLNHLCCNAVTKWLTQYMLYVQGFCCPGSLWQVCVRCSRF